MGRGIELAVLGGVGLNGDNVLQLIGERGLPVSGLRVLDADQYLGRKVDVGGKLHPLDSYNDFSFYGMDIVIVCGAVPETVIAKALEQGCSVIGATLDDSRPVVADINGDQLGLTKGAFFGVPSAFASVMASLLSPLHDEMGVSGVDAVWIGAVGNRGHDAVTGLAHEAAQLLSGKPAKARAFDEKIAFNLLSIDAQTEASGFDRLWHELWGDSLAFNLDCVIAPLFFGDLLSIGLTLEQKTNEKELLKLLKAVPWVKCAKTKGEVLLSSADSVGSDYIGLQSVQALDGEGRRFRLMVGVDAPRFGFALNIIKLTEHLAKNLFISYS